MKIKLRYFAHLRETIGVSEEVFDTLAQDVAGLRTELMARGGAQRTGRSGAAVNSLCLPAAES